ncbi:MAG: hypothetical protein O6765_07930, partial [Gammaproteobacteria bacterium]|nr:hypothetical protein [Gammaproteobacteria bacterium]
MQRGQRGGEAIHVGHVVESGDGNVLRAAQAEFLQRVVTAERQQVIGAEHRREVLTGLDELVKRGLSGGLRKFPGVDDQVTVEIDPGFIRRLQKRAVASVTRRRALWAADISDLPVPESD